MIQQRQPQTWFLTISLIGLCSPSRATTCRFHTEHTYKTSTCTVHIRACTCTLCVRWCVQIHIIHVYIWTVDALWLPSYLLKMSWRWLTELGNICGNSQESAWLSFRLSHLHMKSIVRRLENVLPKCAPNWSPIWRSLAPELRKQLCSTVSLLEAEAGESSQIVSSLSWSWLMIAFITCNGYLLP